MLKSFFLQEQLGYIVSMSIARGQSSQGLRVLVQSHKHPVHVDQAIERFLHSMKSYIAEMKDDEFDRHKQVIGHGF
jgi:secreted Zn-dependent insulinase-like peptidase